VQLSWNQVPKAQGFLVHRNSVYLLSTPETSINLPNHKPGDRYSVAAYSHGLWGPPSPSVIPRQQPTALKPRANADGLVFPGAQGFGTHTNAGNNGEECAVSNLNDSGPGSLRHCVMLDQPRRVTFNTSGTIRLHSSLIIRNPHISILGQTAPGKGILLTTENWVDGAVLKIRSHDVLVQHLRVRAGPSIPWGTTCCRDAVLIGSEIPNTVYNVVLDHNSFSWGTDEVIDIWFDSHDITLSNNIISEGLHNSNNQRGPAGRGLLVGDKSYSISIHHNLFAHNFERNPLVANSGVTDVVNNIVYHWVSRGTTLSNARGDAKVNFVKNLLLANTQPSQIRPTNVYWYDVSLVTSGEFRLQVFFEGNLGFWRNSNSEPEWSLAGVDWNVPYNPSSNVHTSSRFWAPEVTEFPAEDLENILKNDVGATLPRRDAVDVRIINQLSNRTGQLIDCVTGCELNAGGWPDMY